LLNHEKDIVSSYGGQFIFSAGDASLSSRDLIRRELTYTDAPLLRHPQTSNPDSLIPNHRLLEIIKKFSNCNICVVGDLIVDEYIECNPLGMSQEDPTIVVTPVDSSFFLGGAGIVAAHLVGLGAKTNFFSVVGHDVMADQAVSSLAKSKVQHQFVVDNSRPTTLKKRFRAGNKTLLRVSHLRTHDIERKYQLELLEKISTALESADGLIFSDFNYGCLPQMLVEEIVLLCRQRTIPFFADSQSSSQVGDISRFKYADLVCATERESRIALNDFRSGLQYVGNTLIKKAEAAGLLLKLGREGLLAIEHHDEFLTRELQAFNSNPVDVAGAGDALLAAAALTRLCGGSIWEAAYLGSVSAGIQVSRMGNLPISQVDLKKELH
jgi:rfaE bifunctional protein kinase chain/domain